MSARHARADDDDVALASVLHLVDDDPFEADARDDEFTPEVRAVLDAVAMLHIAVVGWAAATTPPPQPRHTAPPSGGRHRR